MLSLDVFSVLLLKRHGIYTVFEAFSTVNCQQQRVPKSSKMDHFWLISGGGFLEPFWLHFGSVLEGFGGPFWTHVFKNPPHSGHESA